MPKIYLWLWSNLGNRIKHIEEAIATLEKEKIVENIEISSFYRTEPIDASGWNYVNCVMWGDTNLGPYDLLGAVLQTEEKHGRKRYAYNNSRTIDIDILIYGDSIINEKNLKIPHPKIHQRSFVCEPLLEINPDIFISWIGKLYLHKPHDQFVDLIGEKELSWKWRRAIMGILNITPDSFYDGWRYLSTVEAILQAKKMVQEWADIIDIWAQSTRPGHKIISWEEEVLRLEPVIREFRKTYPEVLLSVDTFYPKVIEQLSKYQIDIINDVSDPGTQTIDFIRIAKEIRATYIATSHASDIQSIIESFLQRRRIMDDYGFSNYIFDPGFGFWKTKEENFTILSELWLLQSLNAPILVWVSRKSMIYRSLDILPADALNGTSVIHTLALKNGADILRVHDVREAKEVLNLYEIYENNTTEI